MFKRNKLEKFLISLSGFLFLVIFALGIKSKEDSSKLGQLENGSGMGNSVAANIQPGASSSAPDSSTVSNGYYSASAPVPVQSQPVTPSVSVSNHKTRSS